MIDVSELEQFVRACEAASADFKPYMGKALDEIGEKFLEVVQWSIEQEGNVDTRVLLSSFSKGAGDGIYELDMGALTLTIGTNVEYAKWESWASSATRTFYPGSSQGRSFCIYSRSKVWNRVKGYFCSGISFFR